VYFQNFLYLNDDALKGAINFGRLLEKNESIFFCNCVLYNCNHYTDDGTYRWLQWTISCF